MTDTSERWRTCFSDDAKKWLQQASKAKGTEAHQAGVWFRELVQYRLEPYGPFRAELKDLEKIGGVKHLWRIRHGAYRMFLGLAKGQRMVVSSIVEKRRGDFPQAFYKRENAKVEELIGLAEGGRLGC